MIDKYTNLKGHIIVETIDKEGNILDRFENRNLIMDTASEVMSEMIAGVNTTSDLNKFILGTDGHVGGDYLVPKQSGYTTDIDYPNADKYYPNRTNLFSEQNTIEGTGVNEYFYPITFDTPGTTGGGCTILSEPDSGSTIELLQSGSDTTYTITIPTEAANSTGNAVFTEAALYSDTRIFSMKTFIGKIKDNTVSLKVTWTVSF